MNVPPLNSPVVIDTNGPNYAIKPLSPPLLQFARAQPSRIDSLIRPHLYSHHFPRELETYITDYVSIVITPGLYGDEAPHRPLWYYANCLVHGAILGRAYSLLCTPVRPPKSLSNLSDFPFSKLPAELRLQIYGYYKEDIAQRKRFWDVMTLVFIKALWSGRDPEEGSRYITGILMLTCGHALTSDSAPPRGRGARWIWWDDRIAEPEYTWGWQELRDAIMATSRLPRGNTDIKELRKRWEETRHELFEHNWNHEELLDMAREHLRTDERDWTPPEIAAKFFNHLFEGNEEGKRIWEITGIVPQALERSSREESESVEGDT
ncbi:hypothetical protein K469DRAFT_689199 [Zopfia rhizophila CBS 207.26]|uniref:Uncharacterized protein n=1 Tax=Zopfia rhizophila CBS 207.26 TaxID=1314779 RepID=A0A6A6EPP8_9PEZI|nr:hypothetical protein K469DRAFT_689199 [Zopfia rhizophila CBS 207.26]